MTELAKRFAPNSAEVAVEVIDEEAILINLSTGTYYSMVGIATLIWRLIEQQRTSEEIVALLAGRYGVAQARVQVDLTTLLDQLVAERLVLPVGNASVAESADLPALTAQGYEPPRLEIFRDMRTMFALDPPMPSLKDIAW